GKWYYLEADGSLAKNKWIGDYYLGANGAMLTSSWTPDGYYVDENGKWVPNKAKQTGWYQENGKWYYLEADGNLAKNKWIGDYYLGANGAMLTSSWTPDGYYVDYSGKWLANKTKQTGWHQENGKWYYLEADGSLAKNKWIGDYYLGANGAMLTSSWTPDGYYVDYRGKWLANKTKQTGWHQENGKWYYLEADGSLAKSKWIGDYYLGANGAMLTSSWTPDGYYVDENGKWLANKTKQTGWHQENGKWYYLEADGSLAKNKWIGDYYLGVNGAMLTSSLPSDGYHVDYIDNKVNKENISYKFTPKKIADISEHNLDIDFSKLKHEVDGLIIRAGFGTVREDRKFREYANAALKEGIPFGFYWYSYALNEEQAKAEANMFLNTIKNYKPEYPIFVDMEDADYWKEKQGSHHPANSWQGRENIIKTHIDIYKENGYLGGVYASRNWFNSMSNDLNKYNRWVAHWTQDPNTYVASSYGMHQYTSDGSAAGVPGRLDLSMSFVDYPKIIKNGGFNNW
ncbi:GH25 family lysozyme, partial [Gemella sp. zg-1178]|uniref:GH25 family lysozyme n=1 Tax=Gemella sp. zg-1178 TaxID=2840372 RepID=UPI002739ED33